MDLMDPEADLGMDLVGLVDSGVDLADLGADLSDLGTDFVRKGIVRKGGPVYGSYKAASNDTK